MHQTLHQPTVRTVANWRMADDDFWTACVQEHFAGYVDRKDGRYYASSAFGDYLGEYATLEAAQRRVVQYVERLTAD